MLVSNLLIYFTNLGGITLGDSKDVLFFVEHVVRELFADVLIAEVLSRISINVSLCTTKYRPFLSAIKNNPKIVIVPWYTNGKGSERAFQQIKHTLNPTLINSHQEQISLGLTEDFIYGEPTSVIDYHFSWGKKYASQLIQRGICDSTQIFVTGSPRFDLIKLKYFNISSKNIFSKKFSLDENKPWILFCSNFSPANYGYLEILDLKRKKIDGESLVSIFKMARSEWEKWISGLAAAFPEAEIIIRPHPGENQMYYNILCDKLTSNNIKIIRQEPIHKWMNVSDIILTWTSTSMIESWVMGKPTFSMSLCELPMKLKGEYFKGIHWGCSIDKLLKLVEKALSGDYTIPEKIQKKREKFLNEYYHNADGLAIFRIVAILNYLIQHKKNSKRIKPLIISSEYQKELARSILLRLNKILKVNLKNQSKVKQLWEQSEDYFDDTSIDIISNEMGRYLTSTSTMIECIINREYKFEQKDYGIEVVFNGDSVDRYFENNVNSK